VLRPHQINLPIALEQQSLDNRQQPALEQVLFKADAFCDLHTDLHTVTCTLMHFVTCTLHTGTRILQGPNMGTKRLCSP
jgi:hypothetical protein